MSEIINTEDIPSILEVINGGVQAPDGVVPKAVNRDSIPYYSEVYFEGVGTCDCFRDNTFTIKIPFEGE